MYLLVYFMGVIIITYWLDMSFLIMLMMMSLILFFINGFGLGWNLSYVFGYDLLSFVMVLISIWIISLMYLSRGDYVNNYDNIGKLVIVLILFFLMMSFLSMNLFLFYISFEGVLIPTMVLIVGWGFQPERLYAGLYMLFYTVTASLPLFVCLLFIYNMWGNLNFLLLNNYEIKGWFIGGLIVAFLVKLPMYFFHLWLPRAHVEAPVSGSMILAGVLLKLGGYGLYRVVILFKSWLTNNSGMLVSVGLIGGVIMGMVCIGQVDMKMLVAYSSVVHMSLVMGSILCGLKFGFMGALMMMLAHGLCSSCLFGLVGVIYDRLHSRSMMLIKGMMIFYPSLSLWWFLMCVCNMSAPPSFGLLGELMMLMGLIQYSMLMIIPLFCMSFLTAVFSLYLYNCIQHGECWFNWLKEYINVREFLLFFCHWCPLNMMFLKFNLWCDLV